MLNIIDTAGIRKTNDIVESIGVNKSINLIDESDLVLLLLNNNETLTNEDIELIKKLKDKNYIIVINKNDLESKIDIELLDKEKIVFISALNNDGIDNLKNKIKQIFNLEKIETKDMTYLTSARALSLLKQCLISIEEVKKGILLNNPVDMIEIDLKNIWQLLGSIIGQTYEDELIDQLFSQFCLGK